MTKCGYRIHGNLCTKNDYCEDKDHPFEKPVALNDRKFVYAVCNSAEVF